MISAVFFLLGLIVGLLYKPLREMKDLERGLPTIKVNVKPPLVKPPKVSSSVCEVDIVVLPLSSNEMKGETVK